MVHVDKLCFLISFLTGINDGYAISNTPVEVVRQYAKLANFDSEN